jgi:hypothetical protein
MLTASLDLLRLAILLFGYCNNGVREICPLATELILVDPQDERLVLEKDTEIAILVPENISSKHPGEIKLIAASDVLIQDVVIIRRGEPVLFEVAVDKPRSLSVGAVLTQYVEGLCTLAGTDVPLTGRLRTDAGHGCYAEGCAGVILVPWIKGPDATVPAGTLIAARVTQRLEIPTLEARSASIALLKERQTVGVAKAFVYMPYGKDSNPPQDFATFSPLKMDVKIDGRSAAHLSAGTWACFALSDGDHILQVKKRQFPLSVARAQMYYLKIESSGKHPDVVQTPGFQLDDKTLQFSIATERAFKTDCW